MPQKYKIPDLTILKNEPIHIIEMYQGFIIVNFVPTSENISAWLLKIVNKKMKKLNIKVSHIEFYETPKSRSVVFNR